MSNKLDTILALDAEQRLAGLITLGADYAEAQDAGEAPDTAALVQALLKELEAGTGNSRERLRLGEVLGLLGDPRLKGPEDEAYWTSVELDFGPVAVGRHLVTIAEWREFVRDGGYTNDAIWDEEGKAWRDGVRRLWPELAARESVTHLTVPNQPVVGVTWHEAQAYARYKGARLLSFAERMQVTRGAAKRPYPWGQPFGKGNANTREEALGRPCAVGLFLGDYTPEGVTDLAGNVAEWTADQVGEDCVVHPGSWEQDSMASWAKARALEPARTRGADLGFRLARDQD